MLSSNLIQKIYDCFGFYIYFTEHLFTSRETPVFRRTQYGKRWLILPCRATEHTAQLPVFVSELHIQLCFSDFLSFLLSFFCHVAELFQYG